MKRVLTIIFVLVCTGSMVAQTIVPASSVDRASQTEMKNLRNSLIESIAREFKFRDPYGAAKLVPARIFDSIGIADVLMRAAKKDPTLIQDPSFCDEDYVGETIDFVQNRL